MPRRNRRRRRSRLARITHCCACAISTPPITGWESEAEAPPGVTFHPAGLSLHDLFQKSYLTGVIEVVLDHAVQQKINRVTRARRDLFEPRVVNFLDAVA